MNGNRPLRCHLVIDFRRMHCLGILISVLVGMIRCSTSAKRNTREGLLICTFASSKWAGQSLSTWSCYKRPLQGEGLPAIQRQMFMDRRQASLRPDEICDVLCPSLHPTSSPGSVSKSHHLQRRPQMQPSNIRSSVSPQIGISCIGIW